MTDVSREMLRRVFLRGYDDLKVRLARRLGSSELASDALQDTWLRIERAVIGPVARPQPYILRIAYNIGLRRLRSERDMVTLEQVREELHLVDDTPSPVEVLESRRDFELLVRAAEELPARQRDILFAARLDGESLQDIARRFDIPERTAARELRRALLHCAARVDRRSRQRRGPRAADDIQDDVEK